MSLIKFDYLISPYFENGNLDILSQPIIPIPISAHYKMFPNFVDCFLDSGSEFNLMPAYIGENLGFKIKSGDKVVHMGIGGIGITAYKHSVKLYTQGYHFETTAYFSYDHKIPLLGRYGFFKYFRKVTFNEKKLQVELQY